MPKRQQEVAEKRQRRLVKGSSLQAVVETPTEPSSYQASDAMEVRLARLEQQMRDGGGGGGGGECLPNPRHQQQTS